MNDELELLMSAFDRQEGSDAIGVGMVSRHDTALSYCLGRWCKFAIKDSKQ